MRKRAPQRRPSAPIFASNERIEESIAIQEFAMRDAGIGPAPDAWKASVLPLN